jgi:hypothetical protein
MVIEIHQDYKSFFGASEASDKTRKCVCAQHPPKKGIVPLLSQIHEGNHPSTATTTTTTTTTILYNNNKDSRLGYYDSRLFDSTIILGDCMRGRRPSRGG